MIPIGVGRKKDHRSVKWVWVLLLIVLGNAAHSVSHFYGFSPAHEQSNILSIGKADGDEQAQPVAGTYHNCLACGSFHYIPSETRRFLIAPLLLSVASNVEPTIRPVAAMLDKSCTQRGPPHN